VYETSAYRMNLYHEVALSLKKTGDPYITGFDQILTIWLRPPNNFKQNDWKVILQNGVEI